MAEPIKDTRVVVGLDLSLKRTGVVVLFPDFLKTDDPMGGIYSEDITTEPEKGDRRLIERFIYISNKIVEIMSKCCVDDVAIEGYAYSRAGGGRVFDLSELGGIVKVDIFRKYDIKPTVYTATSARKHLMGKYKKNNPKKQVANFLSNLGIYFKNYDLYDAFAVALKHFDEINNDGRPSFIKHWDVDVAYNNKKIYGK